MSYDNIPQMVNMEIPLTSIGVPVDQLAAEIVGSIIRLVEEKELQPQVKKMNPKLSERVSCAPPNQTKAHLHYTWHHINGYFKIEVATNYALLYFPYLQYSILSV